jgi:hypothetical protein
MPFTKYYLDPQIKDERIGWMGHVQPEKETQNLG